MGPRGGIFRSTPPKGANILRIALPRFSGWASACANADCSSSRASCSMEWPLRAARIRSRRLVPSGSFRMVMLAIAINDITVINDCSREVAASFQLNSFDAKFVMSGALALGKQQTQRYPGEAPICFDLRPTFERGRQGAGSVREGINIRRFARAPRRRCPGLAFPGPGTGRRLALDYRHCSRCAGRCCSFRRRWRCWVWSRSRNLEV